MNHKHYWITHFITIDFVDQASGMICFCGETLTQDEVEEIVNKSKEKIKPVSNEFQITEEDRLKVQDALVRRFVK